MTALTDNDLAVLSVLVWRDGRRPELAEKIDALRTTKQLMLVDDGWVPPYARTPR